MVLEILDSLLAKKWNWTTISHWTQKINSLWINDLNIRPEIITFLEKKIGSTCFQIGLSNIFDISPHARETKTKINKLDYIKLKPFCIDNVFTNKMKK